jgi:hypothetical protein
MQLSGMHSSQVCRAVPGEFLTQQLSQVQKTGGGGERIGRGGEQTCVVTSSSALTCVALYTKCIQAVRSTGTY